MREFIDKLLGAIYNFLVYLPLILLAAVVSLANGLDALLRRDIRSGIMVS